MKLFGAVNADVAFAARAFQLGVTAGALAIALLAAAAQAQTLTVNANSNNGAILHGASGWLYGQAEPGLASENLMAPTKPQFDAGKPPNGQQHAGGDVSVNVASFLGAGGKGTQIYLQDYYSTFYPNPGISSYQSTVESIVNSLKSNPDFQDFIYVPFNEPDGEVYGSYGKGITNLSGLESDWVTIFNTIRSINPSAKIAGPNFYLYDNNAYSSFMAYAQSHNALPTQVTWHELTSDFYVNWYNHYNDYRAIEKSLSISTIPVVINEYAQSSELGVPGDLVQYVARFEKSQVYGCLAYWVTAGSLDYLGAANQPNVPTGAWWFYQWYGGMLGNLLTVTPPSTTSQGLQGVATLDGNAHQLKVIFGGGSGTVSLAMEGLNSVSYLASKVHVTVWGVDATSNGAPSGRPYYIQEGDYTVSNGNISVSVGSTKATSGYYAVVTPAKSLSTVNSSTKYEAEYADLFGAATVAYGSNTGYSGTYFVSGYGDNNGAITEFDVLAASSGLYNVDLRYSSPGGNASLNLYVNGPQLDTLSLANTGSANSWADATQQLYLSKGINRIAYGANGSSSGVQLDYINVATASGSITTYEAASTANTLGGTAVRETSNDAPGNGSDVGYVGQGSANYVQFNGVSVPSSGIYRMTIEYSNGETYSGSQGGAAFRSAQISVNGGGSSTVYFDNTGSYSSFQEITTTVQLNAGNNTIRFSNSLTSPSPNIESGWVPVLAYITIASAN